MGSLSLRTALTGCLAVGLAMSTCAASQVAPLNRDPSGKRSNAARAEVRSAHEAMIDWLAQSPHLQAWREYLASRELEQQFRGADAADPAVVSRVLSRYSSGAAGLDYRQFVAVRLALGSWLAALSPQPDARPSIPWHHDYVAACREALRRHALLFISFYDPARPDLEAAGSEELVRLTAGTRGHRYVWARLPLDYQTFDGGGEICLIDHPAFAELRGRPGIAIIDYANTAAKHYRHVVSLFPLRGGRSYTFRELAAMLDLPPGTLTQRTLIYAVRTHPEAPRSAGGLPHHELLSESQSHSTYQASISVQGHHDWQSRFQRINANLGELLSREVVAESWPGESLLDAAIECVNSWHQSAGHWDAVSSPHAEYGYDMQLGSNGVWYATGLFGD